MNTQPNHPEQKRQSQESTEHFFREVQIEFLIHELKDPISIIQTGIKTLLDKRDKFGPLTPRQEKTLQRVLRNTKKTWEMLNNLLEIGRTEAGCFITCHFQPAKATYDVLMDALETKGTDLSEQSVTFSRQQEALQFLSRNGISLDIQPQLAGTEIFQDEIKFRQIVGNLIKNALHYRKDRVDIKMVREQDRLCIDVTDDGPGIEPEHQNKIFRMYTQANQCSTLSRQGHGLGLAGALIMARNLGGDIELKSIKGEGATFRLILPITVECDGKQYKQTL